MSLPRAVAAVRHGVRRSLAGLDRGSTVVVACSGGADSLALAAATVHEAATGGLRVVGASVDHGLQPGSAERAEWVRELLLALGCAEARVLRVSVAPDGSGPEAAARRARYDALDRLSEEIGAAVVLLGHTWDDQAETVLLGLTRGSGARSLAGMRARVGRYARPLLEVSREETLAACEVAGLEPWRDPHNADPRFTRVRVRQRVLPLLEAELGPGVTAALARTAAMLGDDADALDALARATYDELRGGFEAQAAGGLRTSTTEADGGVALPVQPVRDQPRAVATRVLRLAALEAGAIDAELFGVHVRALHDLVVGEIRGEVQLPGHVTAHIDGGSLRLARAVSS